MNNTQKCVLDIIKYSMFSGDFPSFSGVDLSLVYREMVDQTVLGFTRPFLEQVDMDEELKNLWIQNIMLEISHFYTCLEIQQELLESLTLNGVKTCVLKGTSAAKYYPVPESRRLGDIDLIVPPYMFDKANNVLLSNGFNLKVGDDSRHNIYEKNRIIIELHKVFSYISDEKGKKLDQLIFDNLSNGEDCQINGYSFCSLPDPINGLVLLAHLNEHLKSGVGLRHLLDWIIFVDKIVDDNYWYTTFFPLAREIGLDTLAITATRSGQLFFGLPEDNIKWCMSVNEIICTDFIEYIFKSGNFGSKVVEKNDIRTISLNVKKSGNFFKYLQEAGIRNWDKAKQYPILKRVAWLYQIKKYIITLMKLKRPIKQLTSDKQKFEDQKQMLIKFGVTNLSDD